MHTIVHCLVGNIYLMSTRHLVLSRHYPSPISQMRTLRLYSIQVGKWWTWELNSCLSALKAPVHSTILPRYPEISKIYLTKMVCCS